MEEHRVKDVDAVDTTATSPSINSSKSARFSRLSRSLTIQDDTKDVEDINEEISFRDLATMSREGLVAELQKHMILKR